MTATYEVLYHITENGARRDAWRDVTIEAGADLLAAIEATRVELQSENPAAVVAEVLWNLTEGAEQCAECARSFGPWYSGPCKH